jgi:hypothetical protein
MKVLGGCENEPDVRHLEDDCRKKSYNIVVPGSLTSRQAACVTNTTIIYVQYKDNETTNH